MMRELALGVLCFTLRGQVQMDETNKVGIVEIVTVDSFGAVVDGRFAMSVRRLVHRQRVSAIAIGRRTSLKYGTYELTVRGSPAYPVDKVITVNDRYQVVLVPLFLAPIEAAGNGNLVRGKLPPRSRQGGCSWVRLISLVSEGEFANARASESGDFTFENIKPGRYILATFGGRGVCDVAQTTVVDEPVQTLVLEGG
ncbi:MAG: hypothetical protein NTY38_32050 [Acidobacteria bacterium]|nr:hypothetical protein [Acidobacteriota bacterium]